MGSQQEILRQPVIKTTDIRYPTVDVFGAINLGAVLGIFGIRKLAGVRLAEIVTVGYASPVQHVQPGSCLKGQFEVSSQVAILCFLPVIVQIEPRVVVIIIKIVVRVSIIEASVGI